MNRARWLAAILTLSAAVASPCDAAEKRVIGRIHIVGNHDTPAWFLLEAMQLQPGMPFQYPELRLAERDLARSGRFLVDAKRGIRPIIETKGDGPVVDLVVTVHERPWNAAIPASFVATRNRMVGTVQYACFMTETIAEWAWQSLRDFPFREDAR